MIYTITFNPALDYVVHMEKLVLDRVNRTSSEEIYYGGKGINVSTILNELGVESRAMGFVAGFTGEAIEKGVKELGIKTDFIQLKEGMSRINVKVKSGQETEINGQGPHITGDALDELFCKISHLVDGDILVLAGSIPTSIAADIYQQIMKSIQDKKVNVVVDATKELLVNVLEYQPFLIKPNNHELGEIFGKTLVQADEIIDAAKRLQQLGARNVLISMAGDGAILLTETGEVYQRGVPTGTVKNSVGAGDSMVAGFIAGYIENNDYEYALKLGTAAGSATAFASGLATKAEIIALLNTI